MNNKTSKNYLYSKLYNNSDNFHSIVATNLSSSFKKWNWLKTLIQGMCIFSPPRTKRKASPFAGKDRSWMESVALAHCHCRAVSGRV